MKPLAIDLFCGLGGWAEGLLAEGYDVVGFDIERHHYGDQKYPAQMVLQDVLTLHGSQFRNAALIVASPPCQAYSYRAMPWKRAKALPPPSNELFDACFRIQREASEAAGHHIPMVVENVKGAQPWVGRAAWHYGSFYLWGDVPALMPFSKRLVKANTANIPLWKDRAGDCQWSGTHGLKVAGFNFHQNEKTGKPGGSFQSAAVDGIKNARNWWSDGAGSLSATTSSHSAARKAASAQIAKIPFALASHIARVYKPSGI